MLRSSPPGIGVVADTRTVSSISFSCESKPSNFCSRLLILEERVAFLFRGGLSLVGVVLSLGSISTGAEVGTVMSEGPPSSEDGILLSWKDDFDASPVVVSNLNFFAGGKPFAERFCLI